MDHTLDGIAIGYLGLGDPYAEPLVDSLRRGVRWQHAPAAQRAAHAWKRVPVAIVLVRQMCGMDEIEVAPPCDRQPERVVEGGRARLGKVGRVDDAIEQGWGHRRLCSVCCSDRGEITAVDVVDLAGDIARRVQA